MTRKRPIALALAISSGALAARAWAHSPSGVASAWNLDPLLLLSLAAGALFYLLGLRRMRRKAGNAGAISRGQVTALAAGVLALAAALVSPVDALAVELFWVHMVQHTLLMVLAAPLLVLGQPGRVFLWALPLPWRQKIGALGRRVDRLYPDWHWLWQPLAVWNLYAVGLWMWHIPRLYEAALGNRWVHDLQHLTFLLTAYFFWRVLLAPAPRHRMSRGIGVIYLFTTSLHATGLGVLIALSPRVWYPAQTTSQFWNLSPLQDQQLAGLIMWMPACMVYVIAAAALFALWLAELERRGRIH